MNIFPHKEPPFEGEARRTWNTASLLNADGVFWIYIYPLSSKNFDIIEIQSPNNHFLLKHSSIKNISGASVDCLEEFNSDKVRAIRARVEGITEDTVISLCLRVQGFKKGDMLKFYAAVNESCIKKVEIKQYGGGVSPHPLISIYQKENAEGYPHVVVLI